ncbi:polysaccharide pyruvyl transferase family protein [Vulcanisaeta distributa]|uniref:Polysaccharide pyruvyl transferase n=1 Tax=Vulcanisaeta distributa (strain DSM 14429 / JCM 11212 / NBRC 100878 / IC-017) TaxID=572478 RepID=E1QUC5_VULDI|nr:polysaccharide pyruvyl transferase family protein [Vulcanisaeta distributa]ADN49851.1 polysaccharide pyruvyl transferase [Vulcanisaeta distributa DSM 14429]
MNLRVLIHGYFGFGNVGDEAILSALISEFRRVFGDGVEFVVLSSNPGRTRRVHGVHAVRERLLSPTFWRVFLGSHVLVFAGGGRYGYSTWRRITLLAFLARLLRKVVVFRGVGVYPYEWVGKPVISDRPEPFRGLTGALIRIALNRASLVTVRDAYSYTVLRLTGVNRVYLEDDLALRLKVPDPASCRDFAVKYGLIGGGVLGVNLRTLDDETNRVVVDFVAGLIRGFLSNGFSKVVFIPFGFGSFKGRFFDDDLIIAKMLRSRVSELRIIAEELSPLQVLCLFNYLDHVIAMRHHAIIFALKVGRPLTAIVYDTKSLELLRRFRDGNVSMFLVSDIKGKFR